MNPRTLVGPDGRFTSPPTLEDAFRALVDDHDAEGCWPWLGTREPRGYGRLTYRGQFHRAHRLAWELAEGPIPAGLCVCHRCDNPPCVNPAHLFLGTVADNNEDRRRKGRDAKTHPQRFKTACKRGHALTPENLYEYDGHRACIACRKAASRRAYLRGCS